MGRNILQKIIDIIRRKNPDVNARLTLNKIGSRLIHKNDAGNKIISKHLLSDKPELICRFGTVELETVRQFIKNGYIDDKQKKWMCDTAGFFPSDDYSLVQFAYKQTLAAMSADVLACRIEKFEIEFIQKYLHQPLDLMDMYAISYPIPFENPWTKLLKGKKVLVIHPFEDSIRTQYAKRKLLFSNPDTLPEFELITFKPVQGIGDSKYALSYNNWFEALEDMKNQISDIDFDIAIIGAGAYGMFLGAHCKSLGKKAIHMGGATQLLFGIKGKRWDTLNLYNEHWIRPSESEKPLGAEKFEEGTFAYW